MALYELTAPEAPGIVMPTGTDASEVYPQLARRVLPASFAIRNALLPRAKLAPAVRLYEPVSEWRNKSWKKKF
jgi:hypothetical protein